MISRKSLSIALISFAFGSAAIAGGGGTGVRGGGSVLKLESAYALSEVFLLAGAAGDPLRMTPEITGLFKEIRALIGDYTGADLDRYWEEVYGTLADYRVVHKLPCLEKNDSAPDVLDRSARYVACTINGVTYVDGALFAKLDTKMKVISLLHERAHVFDDATDSHERWIYPFVQGVYILLTLRLEQEKGAFRTLKAYEYRALRNLVESSEIYSRLRENSRNPGPGGFAFITPQGGGKIYFDRESDAKSLRIDPDSMVSLGSRIDFSRSRCETARNSAVLSPKILRSKIEESRVACTNLVDSRIQGSMVTSFQWEARGIATYTSVRLKDSTLQFSGKTVAVTDCAIARSFLVHDLVDIGVLLAHSSYDGSQIDYSGYMRDYGVFGGGMFVDGEPVVTLQGEKIRAGRNARTGKTEGFALTPGRRATPYDQIVITDSLGASHRGWRYAKGIF